jgi:hypothetical protein
MTNLRRAKLKKRTCYFTGQALAFLLVVQALVRAEPARATTIQVDLGPSGIFTDVDVPFSDLNGVSLSGQTLSLNFIFSPSQFVRVFSVTSDLEVSLKLQTNSSGLVGFVSGTGFLSDQQGNPLQPPEKLGSASSSDGRMFAGLFPLDPGTGVPNRPFDFFDVHFDLTLPNNPSFQITGSEFELLDSGPNGPFGVGPGIPADLVPDAGSTLFLLALGLVVPVLTTRLRLTQPVKSER